MLVRHTQRQKGIGTLFGIAVLIFLSILLFGLYTFLKRELQTNEIFYRHVKLQTLAESSLNQSLELALANEASLPNSDRVVKFLTCHDDEKNSCTVYVTKITKGTKPWSFLAVAQSYDGQTKLRLIAYLPKSDDDATKPQKKFNHWEH